MKANINVTINPLPIRTYYRFFFSMAFFSFPISLLEFDPVFLDNNSKNGGGGS